jgi:hypothetical protein
LTIEEEVIKTAKKKCIDKGVSLSSIVEALLRKKWNQDQ